MKDWLTTSELAELKLPGFPATKRGWNILAVREGWTDVEGKARLLRARGGAYYEYHIDLLPAAARFAYAVREVGSIVVGEQDRLAAEAAENEQLVLPALDHRDARLALLAAVDRFARTEKLARTTADLTFCTEYNFGNIRVESWVRQAVRKLSPRALNSWREKRRLDGVNALAVDRGAARRGKGALDQPEVRAWLLGFLAHKPHTSAQSARGYLLVQFPDLEISERSVARALSALKEQEKVALMRICNPDAWKSKYEASGENSNPASRLNELWMIDASPADVLLTTGRHSIYACIDRYSRRTIIYVTKTPRAEAVCLLLRRALLAWGVPERIKTDNGSDFKAKRTVGLMHALDIEVNVSRPFDPKAKAHVERVIGTFQRDMAGDLDGFIGHNVSDRKKIEERRAFAERLGETDDNIFCVSLDAKVFQQKCDHWAQNRYEPRAHGGKDMGRKSPFQRAAEYSGKIQKIVDLHALDMLLAPIAGSDGIRTTTKSGVRVDNAQYYTPNVLPGERVFVRMDPADLGKVYLFTPDGAQFLGEGLCPELAGVDPVAAALEFKRQQAELLAERTAPIRRELRQLKKDKPALADAIARREAEAAGKLVSFPKPSETYSTPALEAASAALSAPPAAPKSADYDELVRQIETDLDRGRDPKPEQLRAVFEVLDKRADEWRLEVEKDLVGAQVENGDGVHALRAKATPQQRMAKAREIAERMRRGEMVSEAEAFWFGGFQRAPEYLGALANGRERFQHTLYLDEEVRKGAPINPHEANWLKSYKTTAEYQAQRITYDDFGEAALR